ncbi:hypothetical protein [Rothia nasimurium]|uniref:hypothetical protein n=1 Tax=Rothia nasimurium TaxID=85336 RepID=UPI0016271639|nr:hypothetical protein [Rothia nasimurium]
MKKVFNYIRENWILYWIIFVLFAMAMTPVKRYTDSHYTQEMTCTVKSASTVWSMRGSGKAGASSPDSSVVTEECGTLMLYYPVLDGVGMDETTDSLVVGKKYIFVVNKYLLYGRYHIIQDIKEADGSPVNFGSSE